MAHHSSLIQIGEIYARDMELQLAAEARGVTRKNVPWEKFRLIYLLNFSAENRPKLAIDSVKKIGVGNWKEGEFWKRLRKVLSSRVRCQDTLSIFY